MFIKPQHEKTKPKQPKHKILKPHPENPEFVRIKQMAQIGQDHLSRDYVIEHGKEFGEDLWWDPCDGWFIYDDKEEVNYTGLSYEVYENGRLMYYNNIKDGLEEGIQIEFYPSGELESYSICHKRKNIEIFYEWYENGKIRMYFDGQRWIYLDKEGYMLKRAGKK